MPIYYVEMSNGPTRPIEPSELIADKNYQFIRLDNFVFVASSVIHESIITVLQLNNPVVNDAGYIKISGGEIDIFGNSPTIVDFDPNERAETRSLIMRP